MGNDHDKSEPPADRSGPTDVELYGGAIPNIALKRTRSGGFTSLDLTTPVGRKLYYAAMMGEAGKADDFLNQVLLVTDIVISPAESMNAETGELDRWARCVLLLEGGERVAFGSRGILKSLSLYCDCFSDPPWHPAAEFILKSQPIGKNRWYTLEAATIAAPAPKPKKA